MPLALLGLRIRNEHAWGKHLVPCTGGRRTLKGPGTAAPPTAPKLAPFCQSLATNKNKNKNICWLNPVCPVHRLALLPFALIIFLDFHPCQLVVPH